MTARLSLVFENYPENIFSTPLLAFSFIKRPSREKNPPVWAAKHLNPELAATGRCWRGAETVEVAVRYSRGERGRGEALIILRFRALLLCVDDTYRREESTRRGLSRNAPFNQDHERSDVVSPHHYPQFVLTYTQSKEVKAALTSILGLPRITSDLIKLLLAIIVSSSFIS